MQKSSDKNRKIKVGISHGDINGISYELLIKSFSDQRLLEMFTPVIFGSSKAASYHRKVLNITDFSFNIISNVHQINPKRPNLINCHDNEVKIELGKSSKVAGELAVVALDKATDALKNNEIDVLVTGPVNKSSIQSDNFHFPGHTEYLAEKFDARDHLMLMISNKFRLGVVTGHIPLSEVSATLNKDLILRKLKILNESLKVDFGIRKPRIGFLGLNTLYRRKKQKQK